MEDCIFCKIARREIGDAVIYEDEHTIAFLDIKPVNPGHTLVIPKEHAENIFDIERDSWLRVMQTVHLLAPKIAEAVAASGINIHVNNKRHAGQLVDHSHVHIIPRHEGDGRVLWPGHPYANDEERRAVSERIRASL